MSSRASLNKALLIGNLTRDPELRYTPQGNAVCTFGLATNRTWVTDGQRHEAVEFHRVVSWNKLAELCSQLLTKGRKVFVEGRIQTRSWQTPDGQQRQSTEIVIDDMRILDSRKVPGTEEGAGVAVAEDVDVTEEIGHPDVAIDVPETKPTEEVSKEEASKEDVAPEVAPEVTPSGKEGEEEKKDKKQASQGDDLNLDDIPF